VYRWPGGSHRDHHVTRPCHNAEALAAPRRAGLPACSQPRAPSLSESARVRRRRQPPPGPASQPGRSRCRNGPQAEEHSARRTRDSVRLGFLGRGNLHHDVDACSLVTDSRRRTVWERRLSRRPTVTVNVRDGHGHGHSRSPVRPLRRPPPPPAAAARRQPPPPAASRRRQPPAAGLRPGRSPRV
jgi:hypothetical protein